MSVSLSAAIFLPTKTTTTVAFYATLRSLTKETDFGLATRLAEHVALFSLRPKRRSFALFPAGWQFSDQLSGFLEIYLPIIGSIRFLNGMFLIFHPFSNNAISLLVPERYLQRVLPILVKLSRIHHFTSIFSVSCLHLTFQLVNIYLFLVSQTFTIDYAKLL